MVKIDKGIPLPKAATREKYPFREMNVGDSFFVKETVASSSASLANKRFAPKRFASRKVTVGGQSGLRIWSIA